MNKTTNFFGTTITRLIIGDNPFTGHSYIEEKVPGTEMRDYYTSRKIYETLFKIEESGINCMLPLADPFNIRMIREYQRDGGKMKFIFQAYMPMNQEVSIRQMAEVEPIGVYHQGTTTDYCFEKNQVDAIKANIKLYKTMGIPVGVGTHRPDVIEACEREDWGADFYLTCLHNTRKDREGEQSGFLTGKTKAKFKFWAEDRPIMLE
ncbi:MAG: hypothetical protein GYA02_01025, partial [Clostridiaceae bacterium]|nr:hypothetical protein [Clostridiaceae bacterium]